MNITITQDNSRVEVLGSNGASIIEKLYKLAIDPNNTLTLEGNITSTSAYGYQVDYLNTNYGPDFIVNATNRYIHFEDPNMESYLASMGIGDNGKTTEAQAAAVTTIANAPNSTIIKFNELRYFTSITESKGGFNSSNTGACSFYNWTALQEIDISNFTSLGHSLDYGWNDTFRLCTALKKVIASNKLTKLGHNAFNGCSNLEEISGLSGTITVYNSAFNNCSKLTSDNFQNCTFVWANNQPSVFARCTSLTSLPNCSGSISSWSFQGCTGLTSVDLSNVTDLGDGVFDGCTGVTEVIISNLNDFICLRNNRNALPYGTSNRQIDLYVKNGNTKTKVTDVVFPTQQFVDSYASNGAAQFRFEGYSIESIRFPWITGRSDLPGLPICGNCKSLKKIYVDEGYTQVGYHAFSESGPLQEVWLPSTFTGFGNDAFKGCTYNNNKVIFLNTTTPTFTNTVPTGIYYCPDSAVSDYSAVSWIGNNARGLSQLANISDDYKDMLVARGCTATGSTGNWTIKAPGEP